MGAKLNLHRRNRNMILLIAWLLIFYSLFSGRHELSWLGLLIINCYACYLMAYDKHAAKSKTELRIPEKSLLVTAGLGGSVGATLGMMLFHHKTKHLQFVVLFPLFLLIHLWLFWYIR